MKLFVFDVDGTLVDSQHHIQAAMNHAFDTVGLAPLPLPRILQIVGLSLPEAMAVLAPDQDAATQARMVQEYKNAFNLARIAEDAPLYPGALICLDALAERDDWLLAVAPAVLMLAAALVTARTYPWFLRGASRLGARGRGLVGYIGFKRLIHRSAGGAMPLLVVLLCI